MHLDINYTNISSGFFEKYNIPSNLYVITRNIVEKDSFSMQYAQY